VKIVSASLLVDIQRQGSIYPNYAGVQLQFEVSPQPCQSAKSPSCCVHLRI